MSFVDLFNGANTLLQQALSLLLPEGRLTDFILAHAFLLFTLVATLIVILFFLIALFFDFAKDAWKLPFGVTADVLKYLGLFHPILFIISALVGVGSFILLSADSNFFRILFSVLSVASALVAWYGGGLVLGVLVALAPINTMMMFIATIID